MIHMTKLHVGLLIVICSVEFIDASCLSYGHSCWGAHGKRSYTPQRESKPGEANDRWALFKIFPERNDAYQFKKLFRGNTIPDNEIGKPLNFPSLEQQIASSEEINPNEDFGRTMEALTQDRDEFHQKPPTGRLPFMDTVKPFQVVRLNKPNFDQ